jgi:DNA processing protein
VDETFELLTAALLPGSRPRTVRELCARGPLRDVLAHPDDHGDLLTDGARLALRQGRARRAAEDESRRASAQEVLLVGWDAPEYPELLRRSFDPPAVLYVRGRLEPGEGERSLAVVGSRAASLQGVALARALCQDLARAGLTIVSGLARGIDAAAHLGALDAGGRTVAILGSGLDRLYPADNEAVAVAIAGRGAVVSEFRLGTPPRPGHFPQRNRIIAGWGRAVVVVEAAARSGALGTARHALEEGREVMAVPGHPSQAGASGTNALIRDGAVLVRDARDIAEELGVDLDPAGAEPEDDVLRALRKDAPIGLDELVERSGRPVPELLARLSELELGNRVRRLPGTAFVRV